MSYSNLSIELTKQINKIDKKLNGIYFTPPNTIIKNIEFLKPYMSNVKEILEPSCGSCEYIIKLHEQYKNINITGIEINKQIFNSIKHIENKKIKLHNEDYLEFTTENNYDLIIGNPPYFVMKKNKIDTLYYDYFDGRPNIFILFIIKSLRLLNQNGILSFVLPKNFLNCFYYNKTRNYIFSNFQILDILYCNDNYIETQQKTIILIIQKTNNINNTNTLSIDKTVIFGNSDEILKIQSLLANSTSLYKLNFNVKVGNIVWNQCKKDLTNDTTKTLLIYNSDIKNNKLEIQKYSNEEKKNYINIKGQSTPLLIINRGNGNGTYKLNYCLIPGDKEYLIENHLLCIKYKKPISNDELIILYKKIINSFENEKTKEFINLYFSNNAINTNELANILPIYDI